MCTLYIVPIVVLEGIQIGIDQRKRCIEHNLYNTIMNKEGIEFSRRLDQEP